MLTSYIDNMPKAFQGLNTECQCTLRCTRDIDFHGVTDIWNKIKKNGLLLYVMVHDHNCVCVFMNVPKVLNALFIHARHRKEANWGEGERVGIRGERKKRVTIELVDMCAE